MSEIAGGPGETPANKGRAPNDFLINRTNTPNIQASFAPVRGAVQFAGKSESVINFKQCGKFTVIFADMPTSELFGQRQQQMRRGYSMGMAMAMGLVYIYI